MYTLGPFTLTYPKNQKNKRMFGVGKVSQTNAAYPQYPVSNKLNPGLARQVNFPINKFYGSYKRQENTKI